MSFKSSKSTPFKPAIDPFKGRGEEGGLTHGGQYSVDYVVTDKPRRKSAKSTPSKPTSFLKDAPPVATPRPTAQEEKRMRNASGDTFKNLVVSGKEREEIRELLKGYTCFKQPKEGYLDNCNGVHASWQVAQGKCELANTALDRLRKCEDGFFGDDIENLKRCTNYQVSLGGITSFADKKRKGEYLREMAGKYRRELEENVVTCKANRVEGGQYTYGCMEETASNYNPQANVEDGSCKFDVISQQPDGYFEENQDVIDQAIDPYLDGQGEGGLPYMDTRMGMPDMAPKQAGFSFGNPLLIVAVVAVAGIVMFMANRPQPQIVQA